MAIPIAEGYLSPEIKAPKAAMGQAVDASDAIQQTGRNTINAIQGWQEFAKAQEEMTANEAITVYSAKMNDLNTQMKSKKGLEAVEFEEEYKKKAKQYHSEFIGSLGSLKQDVQHSAVNKINSVNLNNKENSALYFEEQRLKAEQQTSDTAKQSLISLHLAAFDNSFVNNKVVFYNAITALDDFVLQDAKRIGMAGDPVYLLQKQKEARIAFAMQVVDKLGRTGDNRRGLAFLKDISEMQLIPEEAIWEIGRERSISQLKIEATKYPERFVKNGKINEDYLSDEYFPYLKPEDRLLAYEAAKKEKDKGHSAQDIQYFIQEANTTKNYFEEELWKLGFATKRMSNVKRMGYPASVDDKEVKKQMTEELTKNYNKYGTLAKFIELRSQLQDAMTATYVNPETGAVEKNILRHADNLSNDGRSLVEIFDDVARNLIKGAKGQSALDAGFFLPRDLSIEEAGTQYVYDIFLKDAGGDPSRVNWRSLQEVLLDINERVRVKAKDKKGNEIKGSSFAEQFSLEKKAAEAFLTDGKENETKERFENIIAESLQAKGVFTGSNKDNKVVLSGDHIRNKAKGRKMVDALGSFGGYMGQRDMSRGLGHMPSKI